MLDHVVIPVSDLTRSKRFYEQALAPLDYHLFTEFPSVAGYGPTGKPTFWIREGTIPPAPAHVAFTSPDRATVDAFHEAALAAEGTDNGGPGVRDIYHPNYYAAYVLDPDGHNIEAVCHEAPG